MASKRTTETDGVASGGRAGTLSGVLTRLAWVAVLVAVPAALYFFYVMAQFAAIQQRDLRVLAETSDAIEDIAATAATNLTALLDDSVQAEAGHDGGPGKSDFIAEFFSRQAALNPASELSDPCFGNRRPENSIRFFEAGDLAFMVRCTKTNGEDKAQESDDQGPEAKAVARLDLDSILRRVPSTSTLSRLVIVTAQGDVVAEHAPRAGYTLALGYEAESALRISSIDSLEAPRGYAAPAAASTLTSRTTLQHVTIAGVSYELACQPLRLPLLAWLRNVPAEKAGALSVCGFVAESEVRREALQVAPMLLLALIALTALGLLAWPVLKLLSLASTERLRRGDVYFVLLSSLSIVAFVIIAWLDAALYLSLRDATFDSLRTMARQVEENVEGELADLQSQLCTYDQELFAYEGRLDPSEDRDHTDLFLGPAARPDDARFPGFSKPRLPAVFDSVFWMLDTPGPQDGQQVIKGTVFRANTPALNLSSREYFSRVKNGRAWNTEFPDNCGERAQRDGQMYVQSSRSLTTGEFFTALSMRSALRLEADEWFPDGDEAANGAAQEAGLVAAILGPMVSFEHSALSPGLDISLIDRTGVAVFHADPRRARAERVFRDEGVGPRVRSAVSSGVEQCFSGNYRGHPRLLCVLPMKKLPWTVIVSQRQEPILSANIETLASAASYAMAYIAVLVVLTAGFVVSEAIATRRTLLSDRSRLSPRWIWPHLLDVREYWFWNAAGLLGIVLICTSALLSRSSLPLIILPLPLAALILLLVTRRSVRRAAMAPTARSSIFAYGTAAFLLWILVAVLPATGVFNAAVNAELPRAVVAEQLYFMRRLEERACAIADGYGRFAFDSASGISRRDAATARIRDMRGVYRLGLFAASEGDAYCPADESWTPLSAAGKSASVRNQLADLKPLYNETTRGVRYIGIPEPPDGRLAATAPQRCGRVTRLTLPPAGQCGAILETAEYGAYPGLDLSNPARIGLWLIALALGVLLAAFVRYTGRELFFGALRAGSGTRMADLLAALPTRPTISVLSTRSQLRHWLEHSGLPVVDLAGPPETPVPDRARAVLVSGLEDLPADGAERRARLEALLARCEREEPVPIILSFLDPDRLRHETLGAAEAPGEKPGESAIPREAAEDAANWQRVLDLCDVAYIDATEELATDSDWYAHCFQITCNAEERLVLYQVATTGFANPKQGSIVQRLLDRGLLVRDPALGVADEGFRSHIRDGYTGRDLEATLAKGEEMNSRRLRWMLAGLLGLIIAFLSTTQPDVVETWLQFIVAASAGAAALLKASSAIFGSADK